MMNFNDRLALAITRRVGSMTTAYVFCGLSLLSLPAALATGDLFVIVSWASQSFLQLVLLPVILVGQNVQTDRHEAHAEHHRAHAKKLDAILYHLTGKGR